MVRGGGQEPLCHLSLDGMVAGGRGAAKGPSEDLEMGFPLSGDTEDWFLPHP